MARLLHERMLGHPGRDPEAPVPCAAVTALCCAMRLDAADPAWPDRDRCVATGSAAAVLPVALALAGRTEAPDGPAPQDGEGLETAASGFALAAGIGMALAERVLAARFGRSLVDHRCWVLAEAAELDAGLSHEAAGIAAELRLDRLVVLCDAAEPGTAERLRRFGALGWTVRLLEGASAGVGLGAALRGRKPTLIACREAARPEHAGTDAADSAGELWQQAGRRGAPARRAWLRRMARHGQAGEFRRVMTGRLPSGWEAPLRRLRGEATAAIEAAASTDLAGRQALEVLAGAVPELLGGWAATEPEGAGGPVLAPGQYGGRQAAWGARTAGAAAVMNGMALHGGVIPVLRARFGAGDGLRPALHLAARLRRRVVHALCQEDVAAGHLPAGQLASLRAVPDLPVLRPADAVETSECWELALARSEGPSLLVLSPRAAPALRGPDETGNRCARGGYVLAEAEGGRRATLIASGPELAVAEAARMALAAAGVAVAVVSLPCWELFAQQEEEYRQAVLGEARRFAVEAAQGFGWERWLGAEGVFIGPEEAAQSPTPPPTAELVCATVLRAV